MNQTIQYLRADMHRAINNGHESLMVSVLDLKELIGLIESMAARERIEAVGQVLGYVRPEEARKMLGTRKGSLALSKRKRPELEFTMEVYYRELPPKPAREPKKITDPGLAPATA